MSWLIRARNSFLQGLKPIAVSFAKGTTGLEPEHRTGT
jgi:hypothetical protein